MWNSVSWQAGAQASRRCCGDHPGASATSLGAGSWLWSWLGLPHLASPRLSLSSSPPFRSSRWGRAGDLLGLWGLSPGGSAHPFLIRALAEPVLQPSCFPPRGVLRADTTGCSNVLCVMWASPALATQGRKGREKEGMDGTV